MDSQIARLGDRELEYLFRGGKPTTVVLVNGSGGPLISWFGILDSISANHSVLAYNRPGVGRSSPAKSPQTATQMAEELRELMSFLLVEGKVLLVGHSLGGLVVLQFLRSYPHLVGAVVLLEPSTIWDIETQKQLPSDKRNPNGELNFVRESARLLGDPSMITKVRTVVGIGMKSSLLYWLFRRRHEDRRNNLRKLAAALAGTEIVEFEKSGHFPQLSEAKKVADLLNLVGKDLSRQQP